MHTARLLTVSPVHCAWGVPGPRGLLTEGGAWSQGVLLLEGAWSGGLPPGGLPGPRGIGIQACTEADPPPWTE